MPVRSRVSVGVGGALAVLVVVLLAAAAAMGAEKAAEPDWAVEGQWVETCNCSIPCPCWKGTPTMPTHADCGDMLYFHVTKGHYGATKLDGVDVVQMAVSSNNKTMEQSSQDQDFKVNTLYLPDMLSPDVAAAAEKVFGRMTFMPLSICKTHRVKRVPMTAGIEGGVCTLKIPHVLDVRIAQAKDKQGRAVAFPYDIHVVPYLGKGIQGISERYDFKDEGQSWSHQGTNGTWASFSFSSKQLPLP